MRRPVSHLVKSITMSIDPDHTIQQLCKGSVTPSNEKERQALVHILRRKAHILATERFKSLAAYIKEMENAEHTLYFGKANVEDEVDTSDIVKERKEEQLTNGNPNNDNDIVSEKLNGQSATPTTGIRLNDKIQHTQDGSQQVELEQSEQVSPQERSNVIAEQDKLTDKSLTDEVETHEIDTRNSEQRTKDVSPGVSEGNTKPFELETEYMKNLIEKKWESTASAAQALTQEQLEDLKAYFRQVGTLVLGILHPRFLICLRNVF